MVVRGLAPAALRVVGCRSPNPLLRKDLGRSVLSMVPVALVTYLTTWTGWFLSDKGYDRHWADGRGGTWSWIPAPLRSLWHYEHAVYQFNVGLHTPHRYQSNPWSWLVVGRPVSFYYQSPKPGQQGCHSATNCSQEILALGTAEGLWPAGDRARSAAGHRGQWGWRRGWVPWRGRSSADHSSWGRGQTHPYMHMPDSPDAPGP